MIILIRSRRLVPGECRQEVSDDGDERGTEDHNEDSGKNEENHRDDHLDRQFSGLFFGALPSLGSQRLRKRAQSLPDAGTELVGLNQNGNQSLKILHSGSVSEIA
jgi:hypothetical protein